MAEDTLSTGPERDGIEAVMPANGQRRWAKRIGWALAGILAPLVIIAMLLASPIGKRFIADQIAGYAPASGLRFEVGRIEGDIYSSALLHDVTVKDPQGAFLTIPEVELEWNPLAWLWSGLDIRALDIRRGNLTRLPELLPGDPDAPILPDFDIRIDRFAIDNLTLAQGVAGQDAQRVDFTAQVDIRQGHAFVDADGRFGPEDQLEFLLDAMPDGDRFDLALDYYAADDGPIAALSGLQSAYSAHLSGDGSWSEWTGHAQLSRGDALSIEDQVAGFQITNRAGHYRIAGQIAPALEENSLLARALGDAVSLVGEGTLADSVMDGQLTIASPALAIIGRGEIDLSNNLAEQFNLLGVLRDAELLGEAARVEGLRFSAELDGGFRDLEIAHEVQIEALQSGEALLLEGLTQSGLATYDGEALRVPLNIALARAITGNAIVDPHLSAGKASGLMTLAQGDLGIEALHIAFPDLDAQLTLRGDIGEGRFGLAGPVEARGVMLDNVGQLSAKSRIRLIFGPAAPWSLNANFAGLLDKVSKPGVANVAGQMLRFDAKLSAGGQSPIVLRDVHIGSDKLNANLDSRIVGERITLAGEGEHLDYGAFAFDADLESDGPRANLTFADPYPAVGLKDVRLGLAPNARGFALDVAGQSLLGDFDGELELGLRADAPTRIVIDRLRLYRTNVSGNLRLLDQGVAGNLQLAGGGLDGMARINPAGDGGQSFALDLTANGARFGGDTVIALRQAEIDARGRFDGGSSTINADISGSGLQYGALTLDNFTGKARIVDGIGELQAAIAGERADRFALKLGGDFSRERIALMADGQYGGGRITMPRRAVLTRLDQGGYRLAPAQIGYAGGFAIVEGDIGGAATRLEAKLARMNLRLADLAGADLGLGGRLSGIVQWSQSGASPPKANARVRVDGFTRSGLVLSSRPVNVHAVADLTANRFAFGALLRDESGQLGRIDGTVSNLSSSGELTQRIMRGRLNGGLEFEGPAQTLWRLAAIETFDLTGPVSVAGQARGTLSRPRISGNFSSDDLRLQSSLSGTDITAISARGRFAGTRLELTRFAGAAKGEGTVSGSGVIDLAGISASRGPALDLRAAANRARLLNANGLEATISGPLRIVSNGNGGAIAGRVSVDRASWELGTAAEDMSLPIIATREINQRDRAESTRQTGGASWRYLVDARADNRITVEGLGLNSEWGADIALRGSVDNPRIGGEATLVRGDYVFAGTRFELTDGKINFDPNGPIDPRLDIEAQASANGTDVTIDISGNAQSPQIAFSSTPALPQEEILARLLFGGSVTSLSATDAVQLGAALAALQGGNGALDPIGTLRRSVGLDQLRIVTADPALGRGTGVALGKNIGRRVYVELVTDGQGYSASQIEYRVTSWLSLLATVTTLRNDSLVAEVRRDY